MVLNIFFIIDTSASMNQTTQNGLTLLDCAKSAVEYFAKQRARDVNSRGDRYFLITTAEDLMDAMKIGWDKCLNFPAFVHELKNLAATDLNHVGKALKFSFDLMTRGRWISGIDSYAQGQYPWVLDSAVGILLTDGGLFTTTDDIGEDLCLPYDGTRFDPTREPYRWDQRLFTVVLKLPSGNQGSNISNTLDSAIHCPLPLKTLSEITGGACYVPNNLRGVLQSVDAILAKIQINGVVVCLQPEVGITGEEYPSLRSLLIVRPVMKDYYWPIPEPFWVDRNLNSLPSRPSQPTIIYQRMHESASDAQATQLVLEKLQFPVDSYNLDTTPNPAPMRGQRWATFVAGSHGDNTIGDPIGFLRLTSSNASTVSLVLLPYNYQVLFGLLAEAVRTMSAMGATFQSGGGIPIDPKQMSAQWRKEFNSYVSGIPPYYYAPLKKALKKYNLHALIPEVPDGGRSYHVSNYLKRLSLLYKQEGEKLQASLLAQASRLEELANASLKQPKVELSDPLSVSKVSPVTLLSAYTDFRVQIFHRTTNKRSDAACRSDLWDGTFVRLAPTDRAALEDKKHAIPIGDMGSYQEVLIKKEALRDPMGEPEPDEDTPSGLRRRQLQVHFGNPYRKSNSRQSSSSTDNSEAADEAAILRGPKRRSGRQVGKHWKRGKKRAQIVVNDTGGGGVPVSPTRGNGYLSSPSSSCSSSSMTSPSGSSVSGFDLDVSGSFVSPVEKGMRSFSSNSTSSEYSSGFNKEVEKLSCETPLPLAPHVYDVVLANRNVWRVIQKKIRAPNYKTEDMDTIVGMLSGLLGGDRVIEAYTLEAIRYSSSFKRSRIKERLEEFANSREISIES